LFNDLLSAVRSHDVTVLADRLGAAPEVIAAFDRDAEGTRPYQVRRIPALHLRLPPSSLPRHAVNALTYLSSTRRAFRRVVAEVSPDILVAGNSYPCGWLWAGLPKRCLRVNYVHGEEMTMEIPGGPIIRWFKRRQLRSLRTADLNIAVSRYSAEQVIRLAGAPPENVVVLPNPVDTHRFFPPSDRDGVRARLGWNRRTVLLTIARLVPRKGIDQVLRALHASENLPDDWLYVIAGRGPMEPELRDLAERLGLAGRVRFFGFVPEDDLVDLYGAADVFIQPNRCINGDTEGFGIVFLEANACGTPVIGGVAGGTADAIEDGVSGFRVDGESIDSVRLAVERLMTDHTLRKRMGEAGLRRARRDFTLEACARRFEELLAEAQERKLSRVRR
jgi:phosphatidylinositol alpha-1,6-mannosyltransferase